MIDKLCQKPERRRPHPHPRSRFWGSLTTIGRVAAWVWRRNWNSPISLSNGPLHVDVLAERTQTHAPSLYRMLRALESTGIFTQSSPRVFANTPQSECLRRYATGSQWAWIRICLCPDSFVEEGWRGLGLAVKNGQPGFDQLHGCSPWEFMKSNPEQRTNFNAAMRDLSASMTPAVTASYDWGKFPVIADIGGGIGAQLSSILDAHPSCRGILFDQPQVVAESPLHNRMERVGGDFFKKSRCKPTLT